MKGLQKGSIIRDKAVVEVHQPQEGSKLTLCVRTRVQPVPSLVEAESL